MVKCLPEFEYFTVLSKNKNIIFKIRRSKVTDYAALSNLESWREIANYGYTLNLKSIKYLPAKAFSLINFVNSRRQVQVKMLGIIWIHTVW